MNPDEIKINPQVEGNPFMEDEERTPYITPKASSNADKKDVGLDVDFSLVE